MDLEGFEEGVEKLIKHYLLTTNENSPDQKKLDLSLVLSTIAEKIEDGEYDEDEKEK